MSDETDYYILCLRSYLYSPFNRNECPETPESAAIRNITCETGWVRHQLPLTRSSLDVARHKRALPERHLQHNAEVYCVVGQPPKERAESRLAYRYELWRTSCPRCCAKVSIANHSCIERSRAIDRRRPSASQTEHGIMVRRIRAETWLACVANSE
jgi:hypothetical protein